MVNFLFYDKKLTYASFNITNAKTRKMNTNDLIIGKRYMFYSSGRTPNFRANYIRTIRDHLQVYFYEDPSTPINNYTVHSMPANWITKAEDLKDILDKKFILPEDVLLIIDSYA